MNIIFTGIYCMFKLLWSAVILFVQIPFILLKMVFMGLRILVTNIVENLKIRKAKKELEAFKQT